MKFISIVYGLFLLSTLSIYWSLAEQKFRLWTLLIASLVFYASLNIQYLPLLLVLTFINFRFGIEIGKNTSPGTTIKTGKFLMKSGNLPKLTGIFVGSKFYG